MTEIIETHSARATMLAGGKFSRHLKPGDVVLLEGDLGGGKTTFIKGLLKSLGYKRRVLSPTFTLMREYKLKGFDVHHLDLYRLDAKKDLFELGIEDVIYSDHTIFLIEWGEKIEETLSRYIKITFSYRGENSRRIAVKEKR